MQLHRHEFFARRADGLASGVPTAGGWTQARAKLRHTAFILNPGMGTADGADFADGQALAELVALTQWVSPPNEWRIRKFLNPRDLRDLRFFPSPFLGLSNSTRSRCAGRWRRGPVPSDADGGLGCWPSTDRCRGCPMRRKSGSTAADRSPSSKAGRAARACRRPASRCSPTCSTAEEAEGNSGGRWTGEPWAWTRRSAAFPPGKSSWPQRLARPCARATWGSSSAAPRATNASRAARLAARILSGAAPGAALPRWRHFLPATRPG